MSARAGLEARIGAHNAGHYGGYIATRLPVARVWSQEFQRITDAIAAERQIKGWSRAKKEALITGNFNLISVLAKRGGVRRTEIAWQIVGASFETRPCGPLLQHED